MTLEWIDIPCGLEADDRTKKMTTGLLTNLAVMSALSTCLNKIVNRGNAAMHRFHNETIVATPLSVAVCMFVEHRKSRVC